MSSEQFDRRYNLDIIPASGEVRTIKELHITFEIVKTLYGYPNLMTLNIHNPNADTLGALRERNTQVVLNVGYGTDLRLAFKGDIRNVTQAKTSVERIVTVYAGDGSRAFENSIFNGTFEAGITMQEIVKEVGGSFKNIVLGDLSGIPNTADKVDGLTLSGQSARIFDELAKEYNSDWNIQDGVLNILPVEQTLQGTDLIVIRPDTGMVGSPTITERGADVTTLMNTQIVPGARFAIQAAGADVQLGNLYFRAAGVRTDATGIYKAVSTTLKGNDRKGEWYSTIEGIRI